jgi:hypothetical protein
MRFLGRSSAKEREFDCVLARCLDAATGPAQIEALLARCPEHAARLEPLLRTALAVRQSAAVSIDEQRRIQVRRQYLQAAARRGALTAASRARPEAVPVALLRPLWSTFAPVIVTAVLFLVALVPTLALTSSSSLPGDWNYAFKRSAERARLALTLDPTARFNLLLALHERRLGEIEQLAASGRLDPSVLQSFSNETASLVQTVSASPTLGPSEAMKAAAVLGDQAQVLADTVAPSAQPAVQSAVAAAVNTSQQAQEQARQVAKVKEDEAETRAAPADEGSSSRSTSVPGSPSPVATVSIVSGTPAVTGTPGSTATAESSASATPGASTAPGRTGAPLVPPRQEPPIVPPPTPPAVESNAGNAGRLVPPASAPVSRPATQLPPPIVTQASALPTSPPTPLTVPSQPVSGASTFSRALPPGQMTYVGVYLGPTLPLPQALASINGDYDAVYFTQPIEHGSTSFMWTPGTPGPVPVLETGALLSVLTKPGVAATLTYTNVAPAGPGAPSP